MNRIYPYLLSLACCLSPLVSLAQDLPRTTVTYQLGMGYSDVLDTYLSQEKFHGTGLSFLSTTEREQPDSRWTTRLEHQLHYSDVEDRSGSRHELQGDYTFFYGRLFRWQFDASWTVQAGAMATGNLGFIYNTANSNNPAQGRFSLNVMPTVTASKGFSLFHRSCRVSYELNLPLAGLMFSPNYGQSYYEIFSLGQYDHNLVATTFASAPSLRQHLAVSYALWPQTMLSVGYLGDYQQAKVNNLKSHIYSHRLMVGIVRQFSIINHRL